MLDTLKTIHDTLVIRDTVWAVDSTNRYLIADLNSFYSDNYATLIGYTALIIGVVGVVIPLVTYWISNRTARKLKKKIKEHKDKFDKLNNELTEQRIQFITDIREIQRMSEESIQLATSATEAKLQQETQILKSEYTALTNNLKKYLAEKYYYEGFNIFFTGGTPKESLECICEAMNICVAFNQEIEDEHIKFLHSNSYTYFKNSHRPIDSNVYLLHHLMNEVKKTEHKEILEQIISNVINNDTSIME